MFTSVENYSKGENKLQKQAFNHELGVRWDIEGAGWKIKR
jgi:hypothetical protein